MKVIKTMKKLKFWSKKKKKRRINFVKSTPSCDHCCCKNNQFQPSAPPLPSFYEQIYEASYATAVNYCTFSDNLNDFQYVVPSERKDIDPEIQPLLPTLPVSDTSFSYQQYMVSDPVYGVPVATTSRKERSVGGFGCIFNVGVHLIRIACPCFRVKEAC